MIEFSSKSAKETIALGEKLAKKLDCGTVVAFYGGLGMGKTTLISGIAKGMGLTCNVSSPTFAIVMFTVSIMSFVILICTVLRAGTIFILPAFLTI